MESDKIKRIKEHWDKEAKTRGEVFDEIFPLGYAGTYKDRNLQHLEMDSLLAYLESGQKVADLGCGKGYATLYMAWKMNLQIVGMDYSEEMIREAKENKAALEKKGELAGDVDFVVADVMKDPIYPDEFDVVFTERCLINLPTWEEQQQAISNISQCVRKGGLFLMLEGSQNGMQKLNELRGRFGLEDIPVVWHNLFFDDEQLTSYPLDFFEFVRIDDFCSTYMMISRALHPALVLPDGPDPEARINRLALKMPNSGDFGYQKIFVFKKK